MIRVAVDGCIYEMQAQGGINRCFNETMWRIAREDGDIEFILTLPPKVRGELPTAPHIRHVRMPVYREFPPRVLSRRLHWRRERAFLKRLRPDIFHSTYYEPNPYHGSKTVVTVHDFIDEKSFATMSGNFAELIAKKRLAIEDADAIIAVSEATKRDIVRYTSAPEERISVVYHGIKDVFRTRMPEDETGRFYSMLGGEKPYWLFVGKRVRYKNFLLALKAWERFESETSMGTQFVAVGPDLRIEDSFVDFLIEHGLESKFHYLLNATDKELAIAYRNSLAFIFPSLYEGFGIPLIEAMACGTPIIASDIPVFREVAGDAALFANSRSEESLATAMQSVMNSEVREKLIIAGKIREKTFTWEAASNALANVYRDLVV